MHYLIYLSQWDFALEVMIIISTSQWGNCNVGMITNLPLNPILYDSWAQAIIHHYINCHPNKQSLGFGHLTMDKVMWEI